jgi:hypothetical protein
LIEPLPHRDQWPHGNGPVPLAVFVEPPPGFAEVFNWEEMAEGLLTRYVDLNRVQVVRHVPGPRRTRPPLRLPLRVLAVGARPTETLSKLSEAGWYANDRATQEHGIELRTVPPDGFAHALGEGSEWSIVLLNERGRPYLLRQALKQRPRLVVLISPALDGSFSEPLPTRVPVETAVLRLMGDDLAPYFKEFFYGILHDYPLHEAVKAANRKERELNTTTVRLHANPESNNQLRLSDALAQMLDEVNHVRRWRRLGNLNKFIERASGELSAPLRDDLFKLGELRRSLDQDFDDIESGTFNFMQETRSIVPMSRASSSLASARTKAAHISEVAASIVNNAEFVENLKMHHERRVDVALEHVTNSGEEAATTDKPLRQGAMYKVRVHVGHPSPQSIVVGDPPPLDPLLPETEESGHRLEVALFEKDFKLLTKNVQPLYLPLLGSSEPVYFMISAPQRSGVAEARIGLYYRNHLVQSFLLKANVSEGGAMLAPLSIKMFVSDADEGGAQWVEMQTDKQLLTHLTFSRSERLTNLDELGPRALSVAVNSNADAASHTFMLKLDADAAPVSLTEKTLDEQISAFREILRANTLNSQKQPLFPSYPAAGSVPSQDFKRVIRSLAEKGYDLYNAVFTRVPETMQDEMRRLAGSSDKTIQVIRHDPNFVFPWPILYDFQLPPKIHGAPPPPVCLGYEGEAPVPPADYPVQKCSHNYMDEVYCIYGFWGLRHQIEQLVQIGGQTQNAITKIVPASPQKTIRLAVGTSDAHTKQLAQQMSHVLGASFVDTNLSAEDLVDLMWDDEKRPAILVVLGHLEMKPITAEPDEPRIVLVPSQKWFTANSILKSLRIKSRWKQQPNTLVLLMACSAGATEISTLNDFVTALTSAGAAAVVGTECLIFSSLVSRFAHDLTTEMWKKKTLGEAVKFFNRRLVGSGNPLAFVFNYLGDADLTLVTP